jgi:hypothetical protein
LKKRARRPPEPGFLRTHRNLLLLVLAVFVLTADDRHAGIVPDGRQMIWTAVAITETGQLGQARGRDFTYPRESGDSVSRFGMGMSLAQIPAALVAPMVEGRFGPATSQPLFLLAPLALTLLAAIFAGMAARQLGGGIAGERIAILLTALGSPLAGYAAMEFSEPLQDAALAAAFYCSCGAAAASAAGGAGGRSGRSSTSYAFLAGFAAGVAVLAKTSLLAVAPFALLPLLASRHPERSEGSQPRRPSPPRSFALLRMSALGAAAPLALWLLFDIARFGRPLAGYGGERFSHPLLDGLWRLLIGVDKGMIWFFPALLVCIWVVFRKRDLASGGALLTFGALLLIAAKWWAWHGAEGWGPRLLVPAVPLLAAVAAPLIASWPALARHAFVALSIAANVLPLIQHPTPVATLVNSSTWPEVDARTAARIADYARIGNRVAPDGVLATIPEASAFVVYPWFIRTTWNAVNAQELARPPWIARRPDIRPEVQPLPAVFQIISPRQWRFLGRGFFADSRQAQYAAVYNEALLDQTIRAQQLGNGKEALRLAERLEELAPSADSAVMIMESYRILGMQAAAQSYLGALPRDRRADPRINIVIALFEREKGNEESARRFLSEAARQLPGTPAALAVSRPMETWPRSLAGMTATPSPLAPQAQRGSP